MMPVIMEVCCQCRNNHLFSPSALSAVSTYFDTLNLNIPESGGLLPDLLDEIKWEMDWLLKMQDPADGGVYHKLTGPNFIGDVMPGTAGETRYFIGKGSAATFDFAAVCALAYRIYRDFMPSFADSCLEAAKYAFPGIGAS
jgi:endoglucanase